MHCLKNATSLARQVQHTSADFDNFGRNVSEKVSSQMFLK